MPDPDPEPCVVLRFDQFLDVPQAVMAAVATFRAHPERSERQVEVVADDHKLADGDVEFLQPVPYCVAAQVHIG